MATDAELTRDKLVAYLKMCHDPEKKRRMNARVEAMLTDLTVRTGLPRWVVRHFIMLSTAQKASRCIEVIDIESGIFRLDPVLMMAILATTDAGMNDFDSFIGEMVNREYKQKKGGK
jgi:hypothetical protein